MKTMRAPAENGALSAFIDAATSDAGPGYPYGAAFIPWQEAPRTNRVLWRYLHEERPAVIVGPDGFDMLVEPIRTGRFTRLRRKLFGRITVEISYRQKGTPTATRLRPIRVEIGQHGLQE